MATAEGEARMEAIPPEFFGTLFDFVRASALSLWKQQREARSRSRVTPTSPAGQSGEAEHCQVLVDEDQLYFHVLTRPPTGDASHSSTDGPAAAAVDAFRSAFRTVWGSLSGVD